MVPGIKYSIAVNHNEFKDFFKNAFLYDHEIGIPYWFCNKYNVYGCTANIEKVHINLEKEFTRIKVHAKSFFRLTSYSKIASEQLPNQAQVKLINLNSQIIKNQDLLKTFESFTQEKKLKTNVNLSVFDLVRWMNLSPELTFSLISKETQEERENLLHKILKYQSSLNHQSSCFSFN